MALWYLHWLLAGGSCIGTATHHDSPALGLCILCPGWGEVRLGAVVRLHPLRSRRFAPQTPPVIACTVVSGTEWHYLRQTVWFAISSIWFREFRLPGNSHAPQGCVSPRPLCGARPPISTLTYKVVSVSCGNANATKFTSYNIL